MPAKDYAATRYSALDEITPANERSLREVFSLSSAWTREEAGAVGGRLHNAVVSAFPTCCLCASTLPATGRLKWKYAPKPARRRASPAATGRTG